MVRGGILAMISRAYMSMKTRAARADPGKPNDIGILREEQKLGS